MTTHSGGGSGGERSRYADVELSGHLSPDTVEAYEDDGNVVFYDAENPLAWVETSRILDLSECA
ncbi:MAG: hypothetical protein V5A46_05845 [Haloferacaceae archaeon]